MLDDDQINKLRTILKEGFRRNYSMNEIEVQIKESIILKDRRILNEHGEIAKDDNGNDIIKVYAINRPQMIARTETIRLSNEGLMDLWKANDVEKYQFVAAWSDRTCPICMGLDGRIFKVSEAIRGVNQPDIHPQCRCTTIGVV